MEAPRNYFSKRYAALGEDERAVRHDVPDDEGEMVVHNALHGALTDDELSIGVDGSGRITNETANIGRGGVELAEVEMVEEMGVDKTLEPMDIESAVEIENEGCVDTCCRWVCAVFTCAFRLLQLVCMTTCIGGIALIAFVEITHAMNKENAAPTAFPTPAPSAEPTSWPAEMGRQCPAKFCCSLADAIGPMNMGQTMDTFCAKSPSGTETERLDFFRKGDEGRYELGMKKGEIQDMWLDLKVELNMTCAVLATDTVARCMMNRLCNKLVLSGTDDIEGIGHKKMEDVFNIHNPGGRYHRGDPEACPSVCSFLHEAADQYKSFGVKQCHDEFDE